MGKDPPWMLRPERASSSVRSWSWNCFILCDDTPATCVRARPTRRPADRTGDGDAPCPPRRAADLSELLLLPRARAEERGSGCSVQS